MQHQLDLDRRPAEAAGLPYHACDTTEVLESLAARPGGLTADEAAKRLARHGRNGLPAPPPRHPLLRFLAQFNNALIYFLLAGAVAAWSLGHRIDASIILAVVVVNAVVGFVQEGKAENALAAIRSMISPRASALRDGRGLSVAVAEIVPGDIVLVEAGDRVPADLRLLKARGLLIDEATFTYLPVMQALFATRPISFADGLLIVAVGIVAMAILEAEKHLMRRMGVPKIYT